MTEAAGSGTWRRIPRTACPHVARFDRSASSEATRCGACGQERDLRRCLTCGYVGCCESHQAHDTEHYRQTGHPLIRPHRCDYDWLWCYACEAFLE